MPLLLRLFCEIRKSVTLAVARPVSTSTIRHKNVAFPTFTVPEQRAIHKARVGLSFSHRELDRAAKLKKIVVASIGESTRVLEPRMRFA